MSSTKTFFLLSFLLFQTGFLAAQVGLEAIILEIYYISDANDASDINGGNLPEGSVTYRIFADMAPGFIFQSVYGNPDHELRFETTTSFFNNIDWGENTGRDIRANRLNRHTVALDSWVTIGSASDGHWAVLKTEDTNGSLVGGINNNGGSANIPGGLLVNNDPLAGIPLTVADGLVPGPGPDMVLVSDNPSLWNIFGNSNSPEVFSTNNSAWAVLGGTTGPTAENRVLLAQITTDGDLSYKLNIQLGTPDGGFERYVSSDPIGGEFYFPTLTYPLVPVPGCTDVDACNFNPNATVDDGTCLIPVEDCSVCNSTNDGLEIVDTDGDGICDADEIPGCTDPDAENYNPLATDDNGTCSYEEIFGCTDATACNYNPFASDDDGSCIVPEANCTICNEAGDGLDLIDTDGDGICDANEIAGCESPTACNFNPDATDDDGSCLEPVENCLVCNETNDLLILVDSDGDGICDADEVAGCESPSACNFNPNATDDDGSCLEPIENCQICNEDNTALVIVDTDGDGICDADEIPGCTNPEATNYNPEATDDDGSCILTNTITQSENAFSIYPNPTTEYLTIKAGSELQTSNEILMKIYSVSGRLIYNFMVPASFHTEGFTFSTSHLSPGTYVMEIHYEDQVSSKRFVRK